MCYIRIYIYVYKRVVNVVYTSLFVVVRISNGSERLKHISIIIVPYARVYCTKLNGSRNGCRRIVYTWRKKEITIPYNNNHNNIHVISHATARVYL